MSTEDLKLENVKNKLRKLMKLYEGAKAINSEGEANNAAAAIQRLLTEYNLQLSDVHKEEKSSVLEETMSSYTYKSIGGKWEYRLMYVICKWNFCMCFIQGKGSSNRMLVLGKEENMITVKWLHKLLCEKFVELGKKNYKDNDIFHIGLDTYLRRYLMGCADGLDVKFRTEAAEEKKADEILSSKITALVVRNNAAIEEFVASKYKVGKGAKMQTKYDSCYRQGHNDGKNASINKAVGDSKVNQANKVKMLN